MITWPCPQIGFANQAACDHSQQLKPAMVHACKEPCHRWVLGYKQRSLNKNHPHYLCREVGDHLYLNMIDPPRPLFAMEMFTAFLDFVSDRLKRTTVIVHCNEGVSRSPTLVLLYMAKRMKALPNNWTEAAREFKERYPVYRPGVGLQTWMGTNWDLIP